MEMAITHPRAMAGARVYTFLGTLSDRILHGLHGLLTSVTSLFRREKPSEVMSMLDVERLETLMAEGKVRLNASDRRLLAHMRETIEFFHASFPEADPDHTKKYSLNF